MRSSSARFSSSDVACISEALLLVVGEQRAVFRDVAGHELLQHLGRELVGVRRDRRQITDAVKNAVDPNARFNYSLKEQRIFTVVETRPLQCDAGTGQCTSKTVGQDYGDVFALMAPGYNFDGVQNPGVARQGDAPFNSATTALSMPNFYGAHGHDPELPVMSATFIAAGPQIRRDTVVRHMRNIDVAPTIMRILGTTPHHVDGEVLNEVLR